MRWIVLLLYAVAATACGDNATAATARPDAGPIVQADAAAGACTPVVGEPDLALELVATGLKKPIFGASPPDDLRLFVLEQHEGTIRIINEAGTLLPQPFLDIGDEIGKAFEQGIVGLAFHPDYARNGRLFISFTRKSDDAVLVEEWAVSDADPNRARSSGRIVLLEVAQSRDFHNGGHLAFDPDGLLWVGLGDGGPQRDLDGHAQNLDSLRGALLRIDVDGEAPYQVPIDNPFIGVGRGEIFAFGLRNPWVFSIDAATGNVFIGDVGFANLEEIDVIPRGTSGQNFGWPILEGTNRCIDPDNCDTTGLTPPLLEYPHDEGCSIALGPVYRGCAMPGHHGKLFYSDFCSGWLRSLTYANPPGEASFHTEWSADVEGHMPSIAVGPRGEMYMFDHDAGDVFLVVPVP